MENDIEREHSFSEGPENPDSNDGANEEKSSDFPGKCDCERPETPSSDASTSGVCSLASTDLDSFDENLEEKPVKDQEEAILCPVIFYQKRNILDLLENIYPYKVYQTTSVPKMNMTNYWERRSVYHRLGPYGHLDEFDFQKCLLCNFCTPISKRS